MPQMVLNERTGRYELVKDQTGPGGYGPVSPTSPIIRVVSPPAKGIWSAAKDAAFNFFRYGSPLVAVTEDVLAGVNLVRGRMGLSKVGIPWGLGPPLGQRSFNPLDTASRVGSSLGVLSIVPNTLAAAGAHAIEGTPFDFADTLERTLWPLERHPETLATLAGRTTERLTQNKVLAQIAAGVGFGGDIALSADVMLAHAFSFGGTVARSTFRAAARGATERAIAEAVKEGVVEGGEATAKGARSVGDFITETIRRSSKEVWGDIPKYEPEHIAAGAGRRAQPGMGAQAVADIVVPEWRGMVRGALQASDIRVSGKALDNLTEKILLSLAHDASQGLRYRPLLNPFAPMRRAGKFPTTMDIGRGVEKLPVEMRGQYLALQKALRARGATDAAVQAAVGDLPVGSMDDIARLHVEKQQAAIATRRAEGEALKQELLGRRADLAPQIAERKALLAQPVKDAAALIRTAEGEHRAGMRTFDRLMADVGAEPTAADLAPLQAAREASDTAYQGFLSAITPLPETGAIPKPVLPTATIDEGTTALRSAYRRAEDVANHAYRPAAETRLGELVGGAAETYPGEQKLLRDLLTNPFPRQAARPAYAPPRQSWADMAKWMDPGEYAKQRAIYKGTQTDWERLWRGATMENFFELHDILQSGDEASRLKWARKYGLGARNQMRKLEEAELFVREWSPSLLNPGGTGEGTVKDWASIYHDTWRPQHMDGMVQDLVGLEHGKQLDWANDELERWTSERDEVLREWPDAERAAGHPEDQIAKGIKELEDHYNTKVAEIEGDIAGIEASLKEASRSPEAASKSRSALAKTDAQLARNLGYLNDRTLQLHDALYNRAPEELVGKARQAYEELRGLQLEVQQAQDAVVAARQARLARTSTYMQGTEEQAQRVLAARVRALEAAQAKSAAIFGRDAILDVERRAISHLPRKFSDADIVIERLRRAGVEVTPRMEDILVKRNLNWLDGHLTGLEEAAIREAQFGHGDTMQALVHETLKRGARDSMGTGARAWVRGQVSNVVPQAFVEPGPRIDLRNTTGLPFEQLNKALIRASRIVRGLDTNEQAAAVLLHQTNFSHAYKGPIGYAPPATIIDALPREQALKLAYNLVAPKSMPADLAALIGADGEPILAKLHPRVRAVWTAAKDLDPFMREQWAEIKPVMDYVAEMAGVTKPGDMGHGYMLDSRVANLDRAQQQMILEGYLSKSKLWEQSAASPTDFTRTYARSMDEYYHRSQMIRDLVEDPADAQAVQDLMDTMSLPDMNLSKLLRLNLERSARIKQMSAVMQVVQKWYPRISELTPEQVVRYQKGGWAPLRWKPGGKPFAGLQDYLVPPGFAAEVLGGTPHLGRLEQAARWLQRNVSWLKPAVLTNPWAVSKFVIAQVLEQGFNTINAGLLNPRYANGTRKALGATLQILAEQMVHAAVHPGETPLSLAERIGQVSAKAVGGTSVAAHSAIDRLPPVLQDAAGWLIGHLSREKMEEALRLLEVNPLDTGFGAHLKGETVRAIHAVEGIGPRFKQIQRIFGVAVEEVGGGVQMYHNMIFNLDQVGKTVLYFGFINAGESPWKARQLVREFSVEYGPEMAAEVDSTVGSIMWFWRYFRHRAEQTVQLAVRKPATLLAQVEAGRKAGALFTDMDEDAQDLHAGRSGNLKRDPSWQAFGFKMPGMDAYGWEKNWAIYAVNGPWVMNGRIRNPVWEQAGDFMGVISDPKNTILNRLPPPIQSIVKFAETGSVAKAATGLPVLSAAQSGYQRMAEALADPDGARPDPQPGTLKAARLSHAQWDQMIRAGQADLGFAFEAQMSDMLRSLNATALHGMSLKVEYYKDDIHNLTAEQLDRIGRRGGWAYQMYQQEIDRELDERAAGHGPKNWWDQIHRRPPTGQGR